MCGGNQFALTDSENFDTLMFDEDLSWACYHEIRNKI